METTSPRFRFRAGFRRVEARCRLGAVRFAAVRGLWRFVFSADRRRFPPNPALICLALRCRAAIFFFLFFFPLPRRLAGFATCVSRTAKATLKPSPGKQKGPPGAESEDPTPSSPF